MPPSRSSAAVPGRGKRDWAPTEVHEHPGQARTMGCPNCRHTDELQLIIPATHYHAVAVREINDGRVTFPEAMIADDGWDVAEPDLGPETRPSGIRCTYCRWSYSGPDPTTRLIVIP